MTNPQTIDLHLDSSDQFAPPEHEPDHEPLAEPEFSHDALDFPVLKPRRARIGKIARLPYLERDMVNRMLRNNIRHSQIVDALASHGFLVTEHNISNWKNCGGYREWCDSQDRAAETRLRQDNLAEFLRIRNPSELPEVGLQLAATSISEYFARREVQDQLARQPEKFSKAIATLCQITNRLQSLQRQRHETTRELGATHNMERARRVKEKQIEDTRLTYSAASVGDKPGDPITPHRNFFPRESAPAPSEHFST